MLCDLAPGPDLGILLHQAFYQFPACLRCYGHLCSLRCFLGMSQVVTGLFLLLVNGALNPIHSQGFGGLMLPAVGIQRGLGTKRAILCFWVAFAVWHLAKEFRL